MASKNSERLEAHKRKLRADGFKRLSVWVCPELAAILTAERRAGECGGRALERLLLGAAKPRPKYERQLTILIFLTPMRLRARGGGNNVASLAVGPSKALRLVAVAVAVTAR